MQKNAFVCYFINMEIKQAKFVTSVADKKNIISDGKSEVAFVGRSNVGKSSLINSLTNMSKLAKTSSTPGRTQLLNYFSINNGEFYFVDLPGYGYTKTGKAKKESWASLIEDYLLTSTNLKLIILLVDIRHEPSELDKLMQHFVFSHNIPCVIVATKSDKIAKSKIKNYLMTIASSMSVGIDNIFAYSSENKNGKEKLLAKIENYLK